jgi:hypothetical protein
MRQTLETHGALSRGTFAVVVLVSLAVLFAPPSDVPASPPGVDKLVHGALFAALALSGRWAGIRGAVLGVLLTGYGAVSELVQELIGRDAAIGDWVADVLGLLLGLLMWQLVTRHRRA